MTYIYVYIILCLYIILHPCRLITMCSASRSAEPVPPAPRYTPIQSGDAVLTLLTDFNPMVNLPTISPDRDFAYTLEQTKLVYDQMLRDRYGRQMKPWYIKKAEFEQECDNLEKRGAIQEAVQFGVRAQEYLNRQHAEIVEGVCEHQQDYQHKLDIMYTSQEDNWRKK